MASCGRCGASAGLQYRCTYCGGQYCPDHRLPEGHECDGVEFLTGHGRFRDPDSGEVVSSSSDMDAPEPIEPELTVGATPEASFESAPDVRVKSDDDPEEDSPAGLFRWIRRLLGR